MTVSAFAGGEGLDAALRAYGPAAIADAVERLMAIAGALDRAAADGLWHGLLNPADVIVSATDTAVTGIGIAQALEKAHVTLPLRAPYAAPEVVADHRLSSRADQFALAAMAHEWLFGVPIDGPADQPLTLPRLPGVDQEQLAGAFTSALAPDPQDRFPTNVAFVEAVRAAANRGAAPAPPRPVQGDLLDATAVIAAPPAMAVDDLPLDFPPEGRAAPPAPAVLDTPEPPPRAAVRPGAGETSVLARRDRGVSRRAVSLARRRIEWRGARCRVCGGNGVGSRGWIPGGRASAVAAS